MQDGNKNIETDTLVWLFHLGESPTSKAPCECSVHGLAILRFSKEKKDFFFFLKKS